MKLKGMYRKVSVVGLICSLTFGGFASTTAIAEAKTVNVSNADAASYIDQKGNVKLSYFNVLLDKEELREQLVLKYEVNELKDFEKIFSDLEELLPDKIEVTSEKLTVKEIKQLYYQFGDNSDIKKVQNYKTLSIYKVSNNNKTFVLIDNTNKNKSAYEIYSTYYKFVKIVAADLKGETEKESLENVYNYIFDNFKYNASSVSEMLVGNLGAGEMACNGFSRLVNDLLNEIGIKSEIREGYSHFWNTINIDGIETTVDVTTDIVKKKRYLTFGNDTKTHIQNAQSIGFYDAQFDTSKYKPVDYVKLYEVSKND